MMYKGRVDNIDLVNLGFRLTCFTFLEYMAAVMVPHMAMPSINCWAWGCGVWGAYVLLTAGVSFKRS